MPTARQDFRGEWKGVFLEVSVSYRVVGTDQAEGQSVLDGGQARLLAAAASLATPVCCWSHPRPTFVTHSTPLASTSIRRNSCSINFFPLVIESPHLHSLKCHTMSCLWKSTVCFCVFFVVSSQTICTTFHVAWRCFSFQGRATPEILSLLPLFCPSPETREQQTDDVASSNIPRRVQEL